MDKIDFKTPFHTEKAVLHTLPLFLCLPLLKKYLILRQIVDIIRSGGIPSRTLNTQKTHKKMKTLMKLFLAVLIIGTFSCSKPKSKTLGPSHRSDNPFPCKYENDLFSINMPQDWEYDDSEWCGLDSMRNFFDIYDPCKDIVRLHIVKTFIPAQWKDIGEATEMAIFARELAGEETELIARVDSVEIGGYPASILFFANYVGEDTIIQKQFVSYLQDSHIVVYVNEIYRPQFSQAAQLIGDKMIETLKYKKVSNPLDDYSVFVQASIDGLINHPVDEKYIENARRLFEETNSED